MANTKIDFKVSVCSSYEQVDKHITAISPNCLSLVKKEF
jgi:hypothetical protein